MLNSSPFQEGPSTPLRSARPEGDSFHRWKGPSFVPEASGPSRKRVPSGPGEPALVRVEEGQGRETPEIQFPFFQVLQHLSGPFNHRDRDTGQPGHLDPIASTRPPLLQFSEKNDLLVILFDRDMIVLNLFLVWVKSVSSW